MDEPLVQNETPATDGATSGDTAWDEAVAEASAAEPAAVEEEAPAVEEPVAAPEPLQNEGFSSHVLENGEHEVRLETGQVYRGKDQAEIIAKLAKSHFDNSKYTNELKAQVSKAAPQAEVLPPPKVEEDATALAIADLMAPAFGAKNGKELADRLNQLQTVAQQQQEAAAHYQLQQEAQTFLRAVPEFSRKQEDADKIDVFLKEAGLGNTALNFEMAYHTLKGRGEFAATPVTPTNVVRMPDGKFGTIQKGSTTPPMPGPPKGNAPASTGKGTPSAQDLYSMSSDDLLALIQQQSA